MEILSKKRCIIGEGPIWNEFNKKLYQVNGFADEILEIDIHTKEVKTRKLPFGVAAMAFSKNGEMIVSCQDGAYILNPDDSRVPLYDTEIYEIKYGNDAKVGPDGRYYIGTQSSKFKGTGDTIDGKLYRIDKNGEVKVLLDGLILSNGFDWSMDGKRLYHTDNMTRIIREYDFDIEKGEINFTGREIKVAGVDGFTIDKNDYLFVTRWGYGDIAVVDTADMKIIDYIKVPANAPASCCFAGDDMNYLVVVSASNGKDVNIDTHAGYTFISDVKTKGRKPYLFG